VIHHALGDSASGTFLGGRWKSINFHPLFAVTAAQTLTTGTYADQSIVDSQQQADAMMTGRIAAAVLALSAILFPHNANAHR
jgi:hypothetical protein